MWRHTNVLNAEYLHRERTGSAALPPTPSFVCRLNEGLASLRVPEKYIFAPQPYYVKLITPFNVKQAKL